MKSIAQDISDKLHGTTKPEVLTYRVPHLIQHKLEKSDDPIKVINDLIGAKNALVEQMYFINAQLEALYDTT